MDKNETESAALSAPGYVIVHERLGVYLAEDEAGNVFWSNATEHPFLYAPVLDTIEDCHRRVHEWTVCTGIPLPLVDGTVPRAEQSLQQRWFQGLAVARVVPDILEQRQRFASVQACMDAGLRPWISFNCVSELDPSDIAPRMH